MPYTYQDGDYEITIDGSAAQKIKVKYPEAFRVVGTIRQKKRVGGILVQRVRTDRDILLRNGATYFDDSDLPGCGGRARDMRIGEYGQVTGSYVYSLEPQPNILPNPEGK